MFYDPVKKKLVRSRDVVFMENQIIKDIEKLEISMPKYSDDFTNLDPISLTPVST